METVLHAHAAKYTGDASYPCLQEFTDMKYFTVIMAAMLLAMFQVRAQYIDAAGPQVERQGKYLVVDGQKLSQDTAAAMIGRELGESFAASWTEASRKYDKGKDLLISFGSVTFAGAALITAGAIWLSNYDNGTCIVGPGPFITVYAGVLASLTGIGGLIAGTTIYVKAAKRLDSIADMCNTPSSRPVLVLGVQPHGLGLSLNF